MSGTAAGLTGTLQFACCDERRRAAIEGHATLTGIDDLEVTDLLPGQLDLQEQAVYASLPANRRDALLWQRRLTVRFVNPLSAQHLAGLSSETILIEGGTRVRDIRVAILSSDATSVTLRTTAAGDFSRYALRLVRSRTDLRPPAGFDPILARIDFSFKVDCPSEFDCRTGHTCLREPLREPVIDYLAKDYASFRRLILDRMALLVPDWRERSPADVGVALVELLAYAGDHLSYQQDAVATEAYLKTARRRTSVRRHARLVDYLMHDGCNARAWLHVEVAADTILQPSDFRCVTGVADLDERIVPDGADDRHALAADAEWFEVVGEDPDPTATGDPVPLFADHNELGFYTWGDDRCCLPVGATGATLRGAHPDLGPGMVLVFEEVKGPETGNPSDADPNHRQAVRLTSVQHADGGAPLVDPLDNAPITEIAWHPRDRLHFPMCVSARTADAQAIADVSVARGNIVLVDHGLSVGPEPLGSVVASRLSLATESDPSGCDDADACEATREPLPPRFRPTLARAPLTATSTIRIAEVTPAGRRRRSVRFDPAGPARAAVAGSPSSARPGLALKSDLDGITRTWTAVGDLLNSDEAALDCVVEIEPDGLATLRFGNDEHGRRPEPGETFSATYRVGNGLTGNVGSDSIRHVVTLDGRIRRVRNPLAADGATDPETIEEVRRRAPQAFRTQQRAVTPADYEAVTVRHPDVQRAAARLRWTGSWPTMFVAVDRFDGEALDGSTEAELVDLVEPFRLAGHDLEFDDPRYVSIEVGLEVCVDDDYFRADVKARLLEVLSNRTRPDGRHGLFHPDAFSFGQTFYLSPILAAARGVPGVGSADVVTFQRQGGAERRSLDAGRIELGRLEIARLDNDPDRTENGLLRLELFGGK